MRTSVVCIGAFTLSGISFVSGMSFLAYKIAANPMTMWAAIMLQIYMAKRKRKLNTWEMLYYLLFKRNL
jgi:hypothetical protein